jgi:hypothetical protein
MMAYRGHKIEGVASGPGSTRHFRIAITACGRDLKLVTRKHISREWHNVECKACLATRPAAPSGEGEK